MLQNPGLESGSGNTPTCWALAGYGTNTFTWTWTTDAHSGSHAENLSITAYTNGDRKMLNAFNGTCSIATAAGRRYTITVWYKSTARPVIFAFTSTTGPTGAYNYLAQSPQQSPTSTWQQATWTTPAMPAGTTNLSIGMGLNGLRRARSGWTTSRRSRRGSRSAMTKEGRDRKPMATGNGNGNGQNGKAAVAELLRTRTLRVAVVGCGYWGPKVVRAAASLPEVEIAALVDRDLDLAVKVQRHLPAARTTTSLTEALEDETIDAVVVATNPATHVELASEALEAGKHVLVEKPLALSAGDCRTLGADARERGLTLMVGHTFRFSPAVEHVHELMRSRELGEVYYIDSQRLNLGRVRSDVDAIWNFGPHDVSIIQHWFGVQPVAVHCHAYDYLQAGVPDLAFIVLEYDFAVAHIQLSWLSPEKVRRMTVVGSRKMVVYDDVANQVTIHDAGIDREHLGRSFGEFQSFGEFRLIQRSGDMHVPRLPHVEPLQAQFRHFLDCVYSGKEPITNFEDAARVVQILEAATESRKNGGERVELAEVAVSV